MTDLEDIMPLLAALALLAMFAVMGSTYALTHGRYDWQVGGLYGAPIIVQFGRDQFMQTGVDYYHSDRPLAKLDLAAYYIQGHLYVCQTTVHHIYANQADALAGKLLDPGDRDVWQAFYPKLGRQIGRAHV